MFKTIIETARALGADYVCYRSGPADSICIVKVSTETVEGKTSRAVRDTFAAGLVATGQSLYDYSAGQFIVGTVDQLDGEG